MQTALIIDTEVWSLKTKEVVQMAWLRVPSENGRIVQMEFRPQGEPEMGAIATHMISLEEVEEKAVDDSSNAIRYLPKTDYVIGHNVDFDADVLGGLPGVKRICTLAMARYFYPNLDSHRLTALYLACFGVNPVTLGVIKNAHRAGDDVWICKEILSNVCGIGVGETEDWAERMWQFSEKARIPTIMPYGKHKGQLIADVPRDYKQWLLAKDDVDPYLRKALER